jgi:hypothetical protein
MIKLEDWDDEEVEETEDPQSYIKTVIQKGLNDLEYASTLLEKLMNILDPFMTTDTFEEMLLYVNEIGPDLLLGDYHKLLEATNVDEEIALLSLKKTRQEIVNRLTDKYQN